MRWMRIACVGIIALSGCAPDGDPTQTTSVPSVDIVSNDQVLDIVDTLMEYAGTNRVIDVEITRTEVKLATVQGGGATTYAWRVGAISQIDSDIAYVGQEIFDPRDINLGDVGAVFSQAAEFSGSDQEQKLQIVDYDAGHVYMTVTTNPESTPVFFTPEAAMVPFMDPLVADDLASALESLTSSGEDVVRIGIGSDASVYADVAAGQGRIHRTLRTQQFPERELSRSDATALVPFDPSEVSAMGMLRAARNAADHFDRDLTIGFELVIEQLAGESSPSVHVTWGTRTVRMGLDGEILPT